MNLKSAAREAAKRSYSPYSHFPVGAALLAPDGSVHAGCNVENASLGLTQCAERTALAAAVAAGVEPQTGPLMLIYTPGNRAFAPCGACRQVMHELMSSAAGVVSCCDGEEVLRWGVDELLPQAFTSSSFEAAGEMQE
ncbi:MAG: cytidine deaminase [Lysobacterales bacterium]